MEQIKGAEPLENLSHEEFCHEFLKSLSATKAGNDLYSNRQHSWAVLQREDVRDRIQFLNTERLKRIDIDADYVLKRLVEIDQMDVLDIMDENLNMKPLKEWPPIWRQYINNVESIQLSDGEGWLKKIKWPDKVKNLELLGKHIAVGAFKESVDHKHSGNVDLNIKVVFENDGETSTE